MDMQQTDDVDRAQLSVGEQAEGERVIIMTAYTGSIRMLYVVHFYVLYTANHLTTTGYRRC